MGSCLSGHNFRHRVAGEMRGRALLTIPPLEGLSNSGKASPSIPRNWPLPVPFSVNGLNSGAAALEKTLCALVGARSAPMSRPSRLLNARSRFSSAL